MKKSRNTIQRSKILEHLRNVKTHPTAKQVHDMVVKDIPNITLATVYRNLNRLAENGEILRLEVNGEYHYDGDIGKHQHCVCTGCGKILDCMQEKISNYAMEKVKVPGFNPRSVTVKFYGLCDDCRNLQAQ